MEISGTASALLREKDRALLSIAPTATVYAAIELMAAQNIGALPVLEGGKLVGMFSERDYTRKVILQGRASRTTSVGEIMSHNPTVASPEDSIDGDELVGILSIGDLVKWIISSQTATIDQLTKYIYGEV